jgi:hypothetical protein
MADTKEHAYELIDRLLRTQLSAVVGLLEAMLDLVSLANAPVEEEEITPETAAASDRARASLAVKAFRTKKSCASSALRSDRTACA